MKTAKARAALAYSYLRFSHPDQAKGDSVRRQTELRDAWLARNRLALDKSLTLEDKGVSGYTGEHRNNPDRHALAAFLALVKSGRIARGSYLIVENLDRLSREDILPALTLVLSLIQSGIRVVQLLPVEMVYDENANPMHLMMMVMELSRGHSESALKSERVGGAWREKKRRALSGEVQQATARMKDGQRALTARTPCWLRIVDGKWQVIDEAKQAVRQIFRWATEGHGIGVITKRLNAEGVPPIGWGKKAARYWARSYVAKILSNRAVVGEYQPYKGRGRKRAPDGEPIPGYYPAIIKEEEWYAARAALAGRKGKVGRLSKDRINVFAGLLRDAWDGSTIQQMNKGKKSSGRQLVSYRAVQGIEGSRYCSFPFETFERAIFSCLHEIDPADILPKKDKGADKALVISGRLAEVEGEVEKVKNRLQARYSDAVADVLERHEAERKALSEQLAQARQEAASPLGEAWGECRSLFDVIEAAPDQQDARARLRAALRRICSGIWCLFIARGALRLAAVQLWFKGDGHRDYLILHRPARGGAVGTWPAQTWSRSLADVAALGPLDLRKPEHARLLEEALSGLDSAELGK
jgi:DNA invertase Pin-like site-specific DNA recombinase